MTVETQRASAGDVEIAYETFGDPGDPAIVLVMGLGTQMLAWPDPFCSALAAHGRYVVRFDNRDCGLSTHMTHLPAPRPLAVLTKRERPPYTIDDMAADTLGLLDALGLETVDMVGVSMGGYIAQTVALRAPHRLRTLTLIMTSTGSRRVGQARPGLAAQLLRRRDRLDRETAVALTLKTMRLIGSPGFALDEEFLEDLVTRSYERSHDPNGFARQLSACLAQPNRTRALRRLQVPTLVIHGLDDPLVSPTGGLAAARAIPRARFVGYSGMGHDLPRELWLEIADEITRHASRGVRGTGESPRVAGGAVLTGLR